MNTNEAAKKIYLDTLVSLRVDTVIRSFVHVSDNKLFVGDLVYDLKEFLRIVVIAIGKASGSMWEGVLPALEQRQAEGMVIQSIIIGPAAPSAHLGDFKYFPGSHPFPDHTARVAADRILALLHGADEHTLVLYLISGGASAMVEKPIDPAITGEDVREFYQALVNSGLPIGKMNALRKHFSQVKGGRLAQAAQSATQCTVLISDVPDDMLHIVASGPSLPDPSTVAECHGVLSTVGDRMKLPERVAEFFRNSLAETPKEDDPAFRNSKWVCILSSQDLVTHAGKVAERLGLHVAVDNACDDWDYRKAAVYLVDRLQQLQARHGAVCLLSSGEISVTLEAEHGTGGRNLQFTLECARLFAERNIEASALSAGSDGIDGNSPAAGAVCDRTTWERALAKGIDPEAALRDFDSYPLFQALEDAIITGPTGNNLRDLRVLLIR
jgi:hydroxypyruvate reductase